MPASGSSSQSNGRISQAEFYKSFMEFKDDINDRMTVMERRILDKLDGQPTRKEFDALHGHHDDLEDAFAAHKEKDKRVDWFLGLTTLVGGIIGAIFGQKQI